MFQPKLNYARNGDINIAYQVIGEGPIDLLVIPPFVSHLDLYWAAPKTASFFRRLVSFSRLILFDKRGTGLSDPVSERRHPRGSDGGCPRGARRLRFAAGGRVRALGGRADEPALRRDLSGAHDGAGHVRPYAKLVPTADYFPEFVAVGAESIAAFRDALENHWGEGEVLGKFMPSAAADRNALQALGMFERAAASPAMVGAQQRFSEQIDVRRVLPAISSPTLVLHRGDDLVPVEYGRYIADHVPGARFKELARR